MNGRHPPPHQGGRSPGCWRLLPLLGLTLATFGAGAPAPAVDDAPYVLPPWIVAEPFDHQLQIARGDYFASTLGPTAVVTAADWTGRGVTTFAEAFRYLPGVMLQESFGGFEAPRLAIRGSGLNSAPTSRGVALLIDGLPLARADGSFNLSLFDPELFPRLEIYRGTLHMALTPAVLGGVLNADSLVPVAAPALLLRAEGGDFGEFHTQLTVAGPAQAAASFQHSDGWRNHSGQQRAAVQLATHRAVAATTQLEVSVYGAVADYDVPGPLTLDAASAQPDSVSAAVLRDQPRRSASIARVAAQLISPSVWRGSKFTTISTSSNPTAKLTSTPRSSPATPPSVIAWTSPARNIASSLAPRSPAV